MTAPSTFVERNTRSSRMRPSTAPAERSQCSVMDWEQMLSTRARAGTDPELAIILAGPPPRTPGTRGGFTTAATFPTEELADMAPRLVRDEPQIALQYTP